MEWIVVKTLFSLIAVVALMIAVVFIMKKYMYGGQASSADIVDMKIIGTMMVQPKRSVSLLKVMDKVLIIGVTEAGMETLGEISDEKSLILIKEQLASRAAQPKWFSRKGEATGQGRSLAFAEALSLQLAKLRVKGSS